MRNINKVCHRGTETQRTAREGNGKVSRGDAEDAEKGKG
jgi:hypothetical protein